MSRFLVVGSIVALLAPLGSVVTAVPFVDVSGEHFTLNLIGKANDGFGGGAGPGGSRIFVPLEGDCRIDLVEADDFAVTDGNCVLDGRSGFALPDPDPEDDGVASYRVYVRALATPGGSAVLSTCKEDDGKTWCSTETVTTARAAGVSPAQDVSRQTLTICADQDGDGMPEREQIFDDENAGYFWEYENAGLRLAQLRFYPNTPTDISGPCPPAGATP